MIFFYVRYYCGLIILHFILHVIHLSVNLSIFNVANPISKFYLLYLYYHLADFLESCCSLILLLIQKILPINHFILSIFRTQFDWHQFNRLLNLICSNQVVFRKDLIFYENVKLVICWFTLGYSMRPQMIWQIIFLVNTFRTLLSFIFWNLLRKCFF